MSRRLRLIGDLVGGLLALAAIAAPSAGAALPAGYSARAILNPSGTTSDRFGANMVNAGDVNGDGVDDLLVGLPDAPGGVPGVSGKVEFIDGRSGGTIATVRPPQEDWSISHDGAPTRFGAQVASIGDLNGDGVPEDVVSAPGSDINSSAVDMGIVYVLDGKTQAILKRIELAADDRPGSPPGFGKALTSAIGEPACAGFGGTAGCPDAPSSLVARGDLDGRGKSEIVIGAPDYAESSIDETNLGGCPSGGPATCPGLGRVYVYSGEDITGSASIPLTQPTFTILYPDAATAAQQPHFGAALSPIGDVGSCAFDATQVQPPTADCLTATAQIAPSDVPDGYPDFLASAPGLTVNGVTGAGKTFVVDGRHGLLIAALGSPDPQQDAGFGPPENHQTAPGNLGGAPPADIYLSATGENVANSGQGRAYAISGDVVAPGLLARLDDPAAAAGGGFGTFAGLGDVAGNDQMDEFALGRLGGGPIQILSSCGMSIVQTIPDADPGSEFGAAIVPLGDVNGDGYLDLAVGAPGHANGQGAIYVMESNGAPGPDLSCNPPQPGGGGGGGGSTGGGGTTTSNPPGGGRRVGSLAKRRVLFGSRKKTVKIAKPLILNGRIKSSKRKAACERKQKVAIQRFAGNNFWQTIDVAVTGKKGTFSVQTFPAPAQTFFYRARVNQTRRCTGATSNRVKIKVVP